MHIAWVQSVYIFLQKKTFDNNNAGTITLRLFSFFVILGSDFLN